jgi:hypothetical protein
MVTTCGASAMAWSMVASQPARGGGADEVSMRGYWRGVGHEGRWRGSPMRLGVDEVAEGGGKAVSFDGGRPGAFTGDRRKNRQGEGFLPSKVMHDGARTNSGSMRG